MTELVQSRADLERVARELSVARTLYVDTEFESTRAGTDLCLLQVSDGSRIVLIDPLAVRDLTPLAPVFGADGVEWVLHAGLQDVGLLTRSLGVPVPKRLFDTQIAWGLTGIEHAVSLSYLVYRLLGKRTSKPHQADDWKRRPLPRPQLRYAASDVEHLPAIRAELGRRLEALGRGSAIYDLSHEVLLPETAAPVRLDLSSFRNAWQLGPKNQAALVYLVDWLNGLDEPERAHAPGGKVLLSIAMRLPQRVDDLMRVKGVPARWAAAHGRALVSGMNSAAAHADDATHVAIEPPPYATVEETRVDGWLEFARAEIAVAAAVAPELALPQRWMRVLATTLLETKESSAAVDALTGWRRAVLSDAFHRFAAEHPLAL